MIKSMTGFGRAEGTVRGKTFLVEIKSLNGKLLDINMRIPALIKPFEFEIRDLIKDNLKRGSVDCYITVKIGGNSKPVIINTSLIKSYYKQMQEIAEELNTGSEGVLAALLRIPEVVVPSEEVADKQDWEELKKIIIAALDELNKHREAEGKILESELRLRVQKISEQEEIIKALEPRRKEKIREDLLKSLNENIKNDAVDTNRLEQEMVYYIDKIDIREEQVRLRLHCEYFLKVLNSDEPVNGKKLAFIIQEMGREINTTGSKAYDSDIQRAVVLMKDELEKAKEQNFNVL